MKLHSHFSTQAYCFRISLRHGDTNNPIGIYGFQTAHTELLYPCSWRRFQHPMAVPYLKICFSGLGRRTGAHVGMQHGQVRGNCSNQPLPCMGEITFHMLNNCFRSNLTFLNSLKSFALFSNNINVTFHQVYNLLHSTSVVELLIGYSMVVSCGHRKTQNLDSWILFLKSHNIFG